MTRAEIRNHFIFLTIKLVDRPGIEMDRFGNYKSSIALDSTYKSNYGIHTITIFGDSALLLKQYGLPGQELLIKGKVLANQVISFDVQFLGSGGSGVSDSASVKMQATHQQQVNNQTLYSQCVH